MHAWRMHARAHLEIGEWSAASKSSTKAARLYGDEGDATNKANMLQKFDEYDVSQITSVSDKNFVAALFCQSVGDRIGSSRIDNDQTLAFLSGRGTVALTRR